MKFIDTSSIKTTFRESSVGKYEIIFSFIFSAILAGGYLLSARDKLDVDPVSGKLYLVYLSGLMATWIAALLGLAILKQNLLIRKKLPDIKFFGRYSDRKLWVVVSLAIFVCYLPIILLGNSVLTPDSWNELGQITGQTPLSNVHPIIFTAFVSIFMQIGLAFKNLALGTVLFSIAQSAILAMIFARAIVWMRQEKISKYAILATFIFYAILPVNAVAGIIMWKDILFAGFGLLFLLLVRQLYIEGKGFFTRKNIFYFVTIAFLFCTWRNNGIYAYLLFVVLAILVDHKRLINRQHLTLLITPIVLVVVYSVFIALIAKPTSEAESMSVPLQQIARTVKYHGASLSDSDRATINEILPYEQLGDKYNPNLSDPVKSSFNISAFEKDKAKYARLWLKLFVEHKKTYIAATLYNTYGYLYPYYPSSTTTDIVPDNASHYNAQKGYSDVAYEYGGKPAIQNYEAVVNSTVPVVKNIGLYTSLILLALYVTVIKRKRELTGVFLVMFSLFMTTILGPVNGEFRYLYMFVVSLPVILCSVYYDNNPKIIKGKLWPLKHA